MGIKRARIKFTEDDDFERSRKWAKGFFPTIFQLNFSFVLWLWMICLKGLKMRSKLNFIPSYSFNDHSWLLHDYCLTCQNQSPSSGHIICGIKGEISSLLIQTIISKEEEEEAVSQLKAQCYYVCNFVLHFYGVHHFSCF